MVRQRLTNFEVTELDSVGQLTGATSISREFGILQDSGIRVDEVSISSLRFKTDVERRLVDDWVATWLQRARGRARSHRGFAQCQHPRRAQTRH